MELRDQRCCCCYWWWWWWLLARLFIYLFLLLLFVLVDVSKVKVFTFQYGSVQYKPYLPNIHICMCCACTIQTHSALLGTAKYSVRTVDVYKLHKTETVSIFLYLFLVSLFSLRNLFESAKRSFHFFTSIALCLSLFALSSLTLLYFFNRCT